jgi:DNA-binding NarL/FixJ family response regulator
MLINEGMSLKMETLESKSVRLLLADNNLTFRSGLRRAIQMDKRLLLSGETSTAVELYDLGADLISDIDVAVVDIDIPDHRSAEVTRWILKQNPEVNVLLLCNWDWDIYLATAWSLHATGILLRREMPKDLVNSIQYASTGPIYTKEQFQRIIKWQETIGIRLQTLIPRERQVLKLIVAGRTNYEIGEYLSLSENMVEKYVSRIYKKMRLSSRTRLLSFILANHLDIMIGLNVYA